MTCFERTAVRAARLQGCTDDDIADMLRRLRAQDAAALAPPEDVPPEDVVLLRDPEEVELTHVLRD